MDQNWIFSEHHTDHLGLAVQTDTGDGDQSYYTLYFMSRSRQL